MTGPEAREIVMRMLRIHGSKLLREGLDSKNPEIAEDAENLRDETESKILAVLAEAYEEGVG